MLIDDLVANGAPASGCDISCLLPTLRAAQKFVLTPEFAHVADALASNYTGLVNAFPHCRLPFPRTWIEVAHMDRPHFAAAGIQIPQFQVTPRRIGYLLTATREDMSAWKTHLFWSNSKGVSCPPLAIVFDMLRPAGRPVTVLPTDEWIAEQKRMSPLFPLCRGIESHPGWDSASETVRLAMMNHTHPVLSDYGLPSVLATVPEGRMGEALESFFDLARSDWAGEPAFLLAVIGLLNARNAVETETVDNAVFNRKRERRGRLPLFSHKLLKIAHRQQKRVYGEGGPHGDYAPMRGHFVRGHWKVRKTGIYFWHDHVRGDFHRGRIEKDYELT